MAVNNTASKKKDKQSKNKKKPNKALVKFLSKIMLVVVLVVIAVIAVIFSGIFNITEILVEGNSNISAEQIISFSGVKKGTNMFAITQKDIKSNLKKNSYIDDVEVKRVFPNKIKLIVDERKIEYCLQLANSYVYINSQGFVLEISNLKPDVPMILGITTDLSNIKPNDRLINADLEKMNTVIKIMKTAKANELESLITKIDTSDKNNYTIYLEVENKIAYLGNGEELNTRFLYIKSILKEQQGKKGEIFVNVDLNQEYVYFRENI